MMDMHGARHSLRSLIRRMLPKRSREPAAAAAAALLFGKTGAALLLVSEAGRVTWANHRASQLLDLPADAAAPPLGRLLPSMDAFAHALWMNRSFATEGHTLATLARPLAGKSFPIKLLIQGFELAGGSYLMLELTPLSERLAAGLPNLLDNANEGVSIANLGEPGAPAMCVNEAFERLTRLSRQQSSGHSFELLDFGIDEIQRSSLKGALEKSTAWSTVLTSGRETSQYMRISISPVGNHENFHYLPPINSDVTRECRQGFNLRRKQLQLSAILDINPDGIVVLDEADQIILSNTAFEKMTGLSQSILEGKSWLWLDDKLQQLSDGRAPEPPGGNHAFVDTQPIELENMPPAPLEMSATALLHLSLPRERTLLRRFRRSSADPRLVAMFFRDITREKALDDVKSEFLSTAAHELRTPVATILGYSELLIAHDVDEASRREITQTIHQQSIAMRKLINDLLDLARLDALNASASSMACQDLQTLISDVLNAFVIPAGGKPVNIEMQTALYLVDADASQIRLALSNILSNAYKYSRVGSQVNLRIDTRMVQQHRIGIEIEDHGIGMTLEQSTRIFEKFYRADHHGVVPGTGLGMNLVKEAAHLHGGTVEVRSIFGAGTKVTFWLPLAEIF